MSAGHPTTAPRTYKPRTRDVRGTCDHCGKPFLGQMSQQFCSKPCRKKAYQIQHRGAKPLRGTCTLCGKSFAIPREAGRAPKYCGPECRRKAGYCPVGIEARTCAFCGESFPSTVGRATRFCGPKCRDADRLRRLRVDRPLDRPAPPSPCERCGEPVKEKRRRFCSYSCRMKRHWDGKRKPSGPKPKKPLVCVICGGPFASHTAGALYCSRRCRWQAGAARARQRRIQGLKTLTLECPECAGLFRILESRGRQVHCSAWCAKRSAKRRRAANKKGAFVEPVGLGFLIRRDAGVCGICNSPVNLGVVAPDPDAPTVDHIIPLSRGGLHSKANCQLAHFSCNCTKGAK